MSVDAIHAETMPAGPKFDLEFMNSEAFLRNPFTPLRQLREHDPVFRAGHGHRILTRHADCRAMFTDARLKNMADRRCFPDAEDNSKIHAADPGNTAAVVLRKVAIKQFAPGALKRLRDRIEEIVDDLVDAMLDAGEVDLVEAFGIPLAGRVVCEYFGIPDADRAMFRGWIDRYVACGDTIRGENEELDRIRRESIDNLMAYLATLIPLRHKEPTHDMMGEMVTALDAVDPELTDRRLPNVMAALLMSGYESTSNFLSGGPYELLRTSPGPQAPTWSWPTGPSRRARSSWPCWPPPTTTPRCSTTRTGWASPAAPTRTSRSATDRTPASARCSPRPRRRSRSPHSSAAFRRWP